MTALFQVCLMLGVTVLGLQILLNLVGIGTGGLDIDAVPDMDVDLDAPDVDLHVEVDHGDGHEGGSEGLSLLSVRATSSGVAMFGATGLGLQTVVSPALAVALAVVPGFLTAYATAWLMRKMLGMQTSGTLRLSGAVGINAKVYLTVPATSVANDDYGVVHLELQGRFTELRAVTREPKALTSGSEVVVISVDLESETVEVVPASTFKEMINDNDT